VSDLTAVSIVGSRSFEAADDYVGYVLDRQPSSVDTLVSGGARGVDQAAEKEARKRGMRVLSFRPRNTKAGFVIDVYENERLIETRSVAEPTFPHAAKRRNWFIADHARGNTHALWDGMSGGTAHSIAAALRISPSSPPKIWMAGDS
jgi:hypothetical protein